MCNDILMTVVNDVNKVIKYKSRGELSLSVLKGDEFNGNAL